MPLDPDAEKAQKSNGCITEHKVLDIFKYIENGIRQSLSQLNIWCIQVLGAVGTYLELVDTASTCLNRRLTLLRRTQNDQ
jgi:hypothetical protein